MSGIMLNVVGGSFATIPGAPTIGTAAATGTTTATVSYTAPASDGGAVITLYTATSSPSGITGTLSQAGSGTITVGGLSSATAYTFTVTATNSAGTSASSAASNSITTLPVIGQAFGGGFYAGQISTTGNSIADYNLIVAPKSSGQSNLRWKDTATGTVGADSVINGPQNTADIVADGNATTYPAAHFCNDLVIGGFTDWYFPAKNETEVFYYNLKPSTTNNQTFSGVNPNAVPARASNYSAGNPARTSVAIFQTGGTEAFDTTGYWSSSEKNSSSGIAFGSSFSDGYQYNFNTKNYAARVRGARRIAV
jgi:hypothetical protein